jgi:oligoendopeptidase F
LYASDEYWQKDYDKLKEMLVKVEEFKGRLGKAAGILLGFLQLSNEIGMLMERVYVYANQKYHEDTANAVYQDLSNKAAALSVAVSSALSFATPEILTIPEETITEFKREEKGLLL